MGVRQALLEEVKVRSKPHGEQQFRLSWGTEKECTLWLYWSLAVCCVQKGSGAPAHLLPSCSHRHTPAEQGKHESSKSTGIWFLIQQLSQPKPSVLPGSKEHTANLQGIFLDLTGEVQWSLSNSDPEGMDTMQWMSGWTEVKWKSQRLGALPLNLRNTRATKHSGTCLHQEEVKKEAWIK